MEINISDEAMKAASKCPNGLSCLEDQGGNLCKVASCIAGEFIFITGENNKPCPYRHVSETMNICLCPVRRELYIKYRI
ncbi:MAG TPA: hypothetical protein DET40_10065 [Lentisphaeria bacterium]|nr:MAG: hypothetical protein A2X45_08850 [Lentisphaerae bacterium GWF2_50_93]HCE43880.1 hypothetical protein [Lentisphaeria bacterium]